MYCTHGETLVGLLRRWQDSGAVHLPVNRSMKITKALTAKGAGWLVHDPSGSGHLRADYLLPLHLMRSATDALGLTWPAEAAAGHPLGASTLREAALPR